MQHIEGLTYFFFNCWNWTTFPCMYVCMYEVLRRVNISGHWCPWMMSDDDNDGQMIFRDLDGLKLPNKCLTGEEKPRKNLTQETCPDWGSNPGPLHDRCTCCRLAHSGGLLSHITRIYICKMYNIGIRRVKLVWCNIFMFRDMVYYPMHTVFHNYVKHFKNKINYRQTMQWII